MNWSGDVNNRLARVNLELFVLKEESQESKSERVNIMNKFIAGNEEIQIQTERTNYAFRVEVKYLSKRVKAFEKCKVLFRVIPFTKETHLYDRVIVNLKESN